MKMNVLLRMAASILSTGVVVALPGNASAGQLPNSRPPQIIHLDDGTKLTLVGTAFGARQPTDVWIQAEHYPGKWPNYELVVSDPSNTACINVESRKSSQVRTDVDEQWFSLNAFPRWDKATILRVKPYGGAMSKEEFVITNPAPATVTNWTALPLPQTQSDGDLEVILTKLVAGAPFPYRQGEQPPANDPANQCVHLNFDIRQNGLPTTNWQAWPVETSDATGNRVRGLIYAYPTNGVLPVYPDRIHPSFPLAYDGYFYRPGLWPDQSPWKVRLELSRTSGFRADEIWCVTNIPVQAGSQQDVDNDWVAEMSTTNSVFAETNIAGIHLKLFRGLRYSAGSDGQKHITILVKADPFPSKKRIKLSVIKATDEKNRNLDFFLGGTTINYPFEPTWVHDAKSLNLTVAVQKLRVVEFTIQPAKP